MMSRYNPSFIQPVRTSNDDTLRDISIMLLIVACALPYAGAISLLFPEQMEAFLFVFSITALAGHFLSNHFLRVARRTFFRKDSIGYMLGHISAFVLAMLLAGSASGYMLIILTSLE